jgi:DNA-binding MarR family transcriptional regulator
MALAAHTPAGALFTDIVLETFRLDGALLAAGNRLAAGTGLSSARWQVLGAISLAGRPLTAAQIARAMGLTRQSVQRLVDELEAGGLVQRTTHPESRRARLVALTDRGATAYARADRRQRPWANRIAAGITKTDLATTLRVLRELRGRLEVHSEASHDQAHRDGRTGPPARATDAGSRARGAP